MLTFYFVIKETVKVLIDISGIAIASLAVNTLWEKLQELK